jgi:thiamine pyrophosphokinase
LKRAIIVANSGLENPGVIKQLFTREDYIIAVDGGLGHIRDMALSPDLVIGDLDSIRTEEREWLDQSSVEIIQYPQEKDQTDLELALNEVCKRGFKTILILSALGGRIDHELANIGLLFYQNFSVLDIKIRDWDKELFIIPSAVKIFGAPGDIISLIPFGCPVNGVCTKNLAYPLNNETLYPDQTRGVSNVMMADQASVTIKDGRLLCVHFFRKES